MHFLVKILPLREFRFCTSLAREIFHRLGDPTCHVRFQHITALQPKIHGLATPSKASARGPRMHASTAACLLYVRSSHPDVRGVACYPE